MTKRPIEAASPSPVQRPTPRRNDRSHEENQERAYIAASRRTDRSLEARVQSARMASEIHKKRTGKGFKITEEIVQREEMYEEEEDEYPRRYRAFAAQFQNGSPDMNTRVDAYLTSQLAVTTLARQQEVDRQFAEAFPMAVPFGFAAQGAQSGQFQPGQFLHPPLHGYHPPDPAQQMQNLRFPSHPLDRDRTQSMPDALAPHSPYPHAFGNAFGEYRQPFTRRSSTRHGSLEALMSPTDSTTPGSIAARTTTTPLTNYSGEGPRVKEFSPVPVDPSLTISTLPDDHTTSSFTFELRPETKTLLEAGVEVDERMVSTVNAGELRGSENCYAQPQSSPYHNFPQFTEPVSEQQAQPYSFNLQEIEPRVPRIRPPAQSQPESGTPNVNFEEWLTDPNS